jgi:hypothetical protein
MTDEELARALERGVIANDAFRHTDHLRVACVYLRESRTIDEALERMKDTLRRFATASGHAEKYSDEITAFWMYQIAAVRAIMPDATSADLMRAFPRLLDRDAVRPAVRP